MSKIIGKVLLLIEKRCSLSIFQETYIKVSMLLCDSNKIAEHVQQYMI